jgi:hypothetical protein
VGQILINASGQTLHYLATEQGVGFNGNGRASRSGRRPPVLEGRSPPLDPPSRTANEATGRGNRTARPSDDTPVTLDPGRATARPAQPTANASQHLSALLPAVPSLLNVTGSGSVG